VRVLNSAEIEGGKGRSFFLGGTLSQKGGWIMLFYPNANHTQKASEIAKNEKWRKTDEVFRNARKERENTKNSVKQSAHMVSLF